MPYYISAISIYFDKQDHVFIYLGFPNYIIERYNLKTEKLENVVKLQGYPTQLNYFINKNGDIYVLEYIPDKKYGDDDLMMSKGIRLIKYEMVRE